MNQKIILVGPSASGKNFMRQKFIKRGFEADVSYTTRKPREEETDGIDYHFISHAEFTELISKDYFYEWVNYKNNLYGTGGIEWETKDIFIMETDGVSKITAEDRKNCLIIYLNPPLDSRIKRMAIEREWKWPEIAKRLDFDKLCFEDFSDYDILITNSDF